MPNAAGQLTNRDVIKIRKLAQSDFTVLQIAEAVGCTKRLARDHCGSLPYKIMRARRYEAMVRRMAAYVPTIGGGR